MKGLRTVAAKFAVFAVVCVLLFVGLFRLMSHSVGGETDEWTARFASVSGLREGDDVRVAGVRVGRVESIEVVDNVEALVTFTLEEQTELHDNTSLTLRYQNLLGQRYLAIDAPDELGRRLRPGSQIPLSQTSPGFDLTALLNGFEPLFSVLQPGEVNDLATHLVKVLQGEAGSVEQLLQHTAQATTQVARREQLFDQVLRNLVPVLENLDERSGDFDATVEQFRKLMTGLAEQRSTFADTIDHLGSLVDTTTDLLDELRGPLHSDIDALRRTAALLASQQGRLSALLSSLPGLAGGLGRVMQYGSYTNVYLCHVTLEIGGVRAPVGPESGPYSRTCR